MFASVASGVYGSLGEAQQAMSSGFDAVYNPRPEVSQTYQKLYHKYLTAGSFVENKGGLLSIDIS